MVGAKGFAAGPSRNLKVALAAAACSALGVLGVLAVFATFFELTWESLYKS